MEGVTASVEGVTGGVTGGVEGVTGGLDRWPGDGWEVVSGGALGSGDGGCGMVVGGD